MLRNRPGVQRVLLRAGSLKGKKIGEFHWSISLHFVQFRSISFLFIRRREARGHKEGEGSFRTEFTPSCRFTFYGAENSLDSQTLTYVFQPRLGKGFYFISFYFIEGHLVWVIEAHR